MTRWSILVAALVVLLGLTAVAQQAMTVSGRLGATEQEAQEGYFAVDPQTMIVVKPGTDIHAYLRARVGRRVRVTIETVGESE